MVSLLGGFALGAGQSIARNLRLEDEAEALAAEETLKFNRDKQKLETAANLKAEKEKLKEDQKKAKEAAKQAAVQTQAILYESESAKGDADTSFNLFNDPRFNLLSSAIKNGAAKRASDKRELKRVGRFGIKTEGLTKSQITFTKKALAGVSIEQFRAIADEVGPEAALQQFSPSALFKQRENLPLIQEMNRLQASSANAYLQAQDLIADIIATPAAVGISGALLSKTSGILDQIVGNDPDDITKNSILKVISSILPAGSIEDFEVASTDLARIRLAANGLVISVKALITGEGRNTISEGEKRFLFETVPILEVKQSARTVLGIVAGLKELVFKMGQRSEFNRDLLKANTFSFSTAIAEGERKAGLERDRIGAEADKGNSFVSAFSNAPGKTKAAKFSAIVKRIITEAKAEGIAPTRIVNSLLNQNLLTEEQAKDLTNAVQ